MPQGTYTGRTWITIYLQSRRADQPPAQTAASRMHLPKPRDLNRSPTSVDVARLAGLSQTTVSRVLTGHPGVNADTRSRVLEVMAAIGYRPNLIARSMKTSRTGTVGVVVARLSNPLYPELLSHLGAALQTASRQMLVWDSESGGEAAAVAAAEQGLVDGVIFAAATASSLPVIRSTASRVPVVLMHRSIKGADVDEVVVENAGGARLVADHFLAGSRRRIAIVAGQRVISTVRVREDAFRLRIKRAGSLPLVELRVPYASYETGYAAGVALAARQPPPDAVFCVNDVIALGVLDGLRDSGLRVPADTWLVGFDDIPMAGWSSFKLTTVHQPLSLMAECAVAMLQDRLQRDRPQPSGARRKVLEPRLVSRQTAR